MSLSADDSPAGPGVRVAVIGAGLSGLSAAFYLRRQLPPGAHVTLFEAAERPGGVIATERRDGWLIEQGADCFSIQPPEALQLCEDLGVAERLIEPRAAGRGAMILRAGRLYPVPEGFVLMRPTRLGSLLTTPLLSPTGKARLMLEPLVPRRRDEGDESVASFARRRLGTEVFQRIVQPLVGGIYTADAERLSMQATMRPFVAMEREHGSLIRAALVQRRRGGGALERSSSGARYGQFRVLPGGMGELLETLVDSLPAHSLRLATSVEAIEREGARWRLRIAGGENAVVDAVVLALPGAAAAPLIQPLSPRAAESLGAIPYASSAIVLTGCRVDQIARLPQTFGFVVPQAERRSILAVSFASHKFPGRAPEGQVLIRTFVGGALQAELLRQSDDLLIEAVHRELAELIGLQGEPSLTAVRRWNAAMPQYHVGHVPRAEEIEAALAELPGLELAGNALHGVGIAPVVATARRAAERVAAHVENPS